MACDAIDSGRANSEELALVAQAAAQVALAEQASIIARMYHATWHYILSRDGQVGARWLHAATGALQELGAKIKAEQSE